jgi:acetyltransferase (GNAT) family protein
MTMAMTKRWLHGTELTEDEWDRIDRILQAQGWSSLNRQTTFLWLAEDEHGIAGFMVCQLHPLVGPAYARPSARGTGLAAELADDMVAKLQELEARGWLVIAESAHAAKLCEERGMTRVTEPVFRTQ